MSEKPQEKAREHKRYLEAEALRIDALEAVYRVLPEGSAERADAYGAFCDAMNEVRDRPLRVLQAARAQGFYAPCRHLEHDATRELVLMNID